MSTNNKNHDESKERKALMQRLINCLNTLVKRKALVFVFRRYKKFEGPPGNKRRHPKLIVAVTDDQYGFMGLTESSKHGKTKNIQLIPNPKPGDTRKAHVRKELRFDYQDNFYDILEDYQLSDDSLKEILQYLETRKKK